MSSSYDDGFDVGSPNVARRQINASSLVSGEDEIARVIRISQEEYHSTSNETELEQIAEAMRLSIEDEMRMQDDEEHMLKEAIKQSLEQVRSEDAEAESQLQAAIKDSLLEICKSQAITNPSTELELKSKLFKSQTDLEKEKMRAARLRVLEGVALSKSKS